VKRETSRWGGQGRSKKGAREGGEEGESKMEGNRREGGGHMDEDDWTRNKDWTGMIKNGMG
jgi:hypothetical protein